jgi:Rrf2 family iron-sulfur cluster assembly transcriptional regulator
MKITTKGRYGVRAVIYLASSYYNRPISIKTIAAQEKISPEFLEQIFFKLKKAGIINSVRGPGGGFVLSKKTSEISIKDILDAVGESTFPVPCTDKDYTCDNSSECVANSIWKDFSGMIEEFLSSTTIKTILEKNGKKYYENIEQGQDFSI